MSLAQGIDALDAGNYAAAESILQAIVTHDPRAHAAWHALSVTAMRSGFADVAVERARRALELDKRNVLYLNTLGIAYGELGEFSAAEKLFRRAVKVKPASVEARYNLGKVLHKLGRLAESLKEYERAYAIAPESRQAQVGLAEISLVHGQPGRAMRLLSAAGAAEDPNLIARYTECLADVESPEAAVDWLRAVLVQRPDWRFVHYLLAVLLLALGSWRDAWKHYFLWWRTHRLPERAAAPEPLPARLDGERILLRGELGLGDILFYLRFAGELRSRGAAIAVACPARLAPLLAPDVAVIDEHDRQAAFDRSLWLGDLPGLLEAESSPGAFPLRADAAESARARQKLASLGPPPYLGLTWRAGTDVLRGREFGADRSLLSKEIPPVSVGEAVRGWRGTLVSLQRGPRAAELEALVTAAAAPVHDLASVNENLPEALAILEALDDYVAVSNTNIHLLAGRGRTARVLVPHPPQWRWMRREGPSPWFPGFAIYRQPVTREWAQPLARLRQELFAART